MSVPLRVLGELYDQQAWREHGRTLKRAWEDILVDETERVGKGQIMKGLALHVNVDFLVKVIGSHRRMLSSKVAWLVLHFRHITGASVDGDLERTALGMGRSVQESLSCWNSQASFPGRRQHGSFLDDSGKVPVKTGKEPSLLLKICKKIQVSEHLLSAKTQNTAQQLGKSPLLTVWP